MNDQAPRVGLLLPTREVEMGTGGPGLGDLVDLAVAAEDAGLDSVWVGDSPLARPRAEPFTLLGAVAARTARVVVGTAALLPALRPPLHTAHAAATLDQLATGRVTLGVGAGFPLDATEAELTAFGAPFAGRTRRLDRTVALWRAVWSGDVEAAVPAARALGIEATAATLATLPRPATPGGPSVWLAAGATPAVMARVARHYDGWLPYVPTPDAYATGAAALLAARPRPPIGSASPLTDTHTGPTRAVAAQSAPWSPSSTGSESPFADTDGGAGRRRAIEAGQAAAPLGDAQGGCTSTIALPSVASVPTSTGPAMPPDDAGDVGADAARSASPVTGAGEDGSGPALGLYLTLTLAEDATPPAIAHARAVHEAYLLAYYGVSADVIASLQACHVGDPASAVAFLGRYLAAGARHLVVRLAATDHHRQLRLLADHVVPALRALPTAWSTIGTGA